MRTIYFSPRFVRAMKRLSPELKTIVIEREAIFRRDPFDPRLKTHRLSGKLAGYYAFSITYSHRILFEIVDDKSIIFINVGDHSIYQ